MRIDILTSLAKKDKTFTFEEALKISGLPRGSLKKVIYRLEQRGAIERIEKGKYMIIPLGAEKGKYTLNEFIIYWFFAGKSLFIALLTGAHSIFMA